MLKDMTPYYLECCKELEWPVDHTLVAKMKAENEAKLKVFLDNPCSVIGTCYRNNYT